VLLLAGSDGGRLVRPLPRTRFSSCSSRALLDGAPPLDWYLDPLMRFLGVLTITWSVDGRPVAWASILPCRRLRLWFPAIAADQGWTRTDPLRDEIAAGRTAVDVRNLESGAVRVSTPERPPWTSCVPDVSGGFNMIAAALTELARLRPRSC